MSLRKNGTPKVRVMYFYDNTTTYICSDPDCKRWHIAYCRFEGEAICDGCGRTLNVRIFPGTPQPVSD